MPTTAAHQDKQSRTHLALSDLEQSQNSPQHADWIVTLVFYKALHAVDAYLATLEIHPKGHVTRNRSVRRYIEDIFSQYFALYDASREARYETYTYQDNPQAVTGLVNDSVFIEEYINTLL